jgi:hypothetical protein
MDAAPVALSLPCNEVIECVIMQLGRLQIVFYLPAVVVIVHGISK